MGTPKNVFLCVLPKVCVFLQRRSLCFGLLPALLVWPDGKIRKNVFFRGSGIHLFRVLRGAQFRVAERARPGQPFLLFPRTPSAAGKGPFYGACGSMQARYARPCLALGRMASLRCNRKGQDWPGPVCLGASVASYSGGARQLR